MIMLVSKHIIGNLKNFLIEIGQLSGFTGRVFTETFKRPFEFKEFLRQWMCQVDANTQSARTKIWRIGQVRRKYWKAVFPLSSHSAALLRPVHERSGRLAAQIPSGCDKMRRRMANIHPAVRSSSKSVSRRGIDNRFNLGYDVGREPADLGMLANSVFIFGKIDTKRLVAGNVGMAPLDAWVELRQGIIWRSGRTRHLIAAHPADTGNVAFYDIAFQWHTNLPFVGVKSIPPAPGFVT